MKKLLIILGLGISLVACKQGITPAKTEMSRTAIKQSHTSSHKKNRRAVSKKGIKAKKKTKYNVSKSSNTTKVQSVKQKKDVRKSQISQTKVTRNSGDDIHKNSKRISHSSNAKSRTGSKKKLSKDEIQYFKSLCRYALMSEQEIIEHGCETKKATIAK